MVGRKSQIMVSRKAELLSGRSVSGLLVRDSAGMSSAERPDCGQQIGSGWTRLIGMSLSRKSQDWNKFIVGKNRLCVLS